MSDCIFCQIIAGKIPSDILYEDEEILAFRDISPQAPVHFLVIPKKHIAMPADVTQADENVMGRLFRVAAQVAKDEQVADNYRIVMNNGAQSGQEVFHVHMHILGGKQKPWPI